MDNILSEAEKLGARLVGDPLKPMQFHLPLLSRLAFDSSDGHLTICTWWKIKQRLRSLRPTAWEECRMKVAEAAAAVDPPNAVYPFPEYVVLTCQRLEQTCLADTQIINYLHHLCMRGGEDATLRYDEACKERRRNIVELKRRLSVMTLFCFFCEAGGEQRWSGLKLVSSFIQERAGDFKVLQRYCRVLDVDTFVSRRVTWGTDDKPIKLEYVMDDGNLPEYVTEEVEQNAEREWWLWVKNVIDSLHQAQISCSEEDYTNLRALLKRIDEHGWNTQTVVSALDDWILDE